MLHKFRIGQMVRYSGTFARAHAVAGTYEVVGQMPARDGANQYRIKRLDDPHQRVVNEPELRSDGVAVDDTPLFGRRH